MELKWIKISTDIFENRKVKQIETLPDGDSILIIWFKLLTLAGKINSNGDIYFTPDIPYTDQMLATQFGRPIELVRTALNIFEHFGMIENIDGNMSISNWEKYQNTDGLAKTREQTRQRVARYRERIKNSNSSDCSNAGNPSQQTTDIPTCQDVTCSTDVTQQCNVTCNADVMQCNAIEKEKEKEIDIDKELENNNTSSSTPTAKRHTHPRDNEFDRIWALYPSQRKQGKERARKAFIAALRSGTEVSAIENGLEAYKRYIKANKTPPQYIKQGGTWFSERGWEDDYPETPIETNSNAPKNNNRALNYRQNRYTKEQLTALGIDFGDNIYAEGAGDG